MASGIYPPVPDNTKQEHVPTSHKSGMCSWLHAFRGRLAALMRACFSKVFACAKVKSRTVPIIHEEVRLTSEGAEVWKQAMDPNSSVGKPIHHRRRRLANG